ncbi:hypothetical protein ACFC58_29110 [Kitasatospora purpeofusca]|uniref:hypothetical protein n=1 Tax=Kitasatospora purpeofusca TaxID=67352 RepID=UPI0035DF9B33
MNRYSDMHARVADLVLPEHPPACVTSVLETCCELIRQSYYRYEFTTVAVAYSMFALERALAEHLGAKKTLQQLIERAAATRAAGTDLRGARDGCSARERPRRAAVHAAAPTRGERHVRGAMFPGEQRLAAVAVAC